jgi:hypothetical protein
MAMHFLRLQISQGNFHKAWLRVRHCISLAELVGLSRPHSVPNNSNLGDADALLRFKKLQLWEFM